MSLFLNADELAELTGYRKKKLQKAALARMGVAFRSRDHDGFPLVLRAQFETLTKREKRREPRFDLMQ